MSILYLGVEPPFTTRGTTNPVSSDGATAEQFDDFLNRLGVTPNGDGYPDIFSYLAGIISATQGGIGEQVLKAANRVETYTYLDSGTADQRIQTITTTSSSFPATTVTDTITYAGSSGAYSIAKRTRVVS